MTKTIITSTVRSAAKRLCAFFTDTGANGWTPGMSTSRAAWTTAAMRKARAIPTVLTSRGTQTVISTAVRPAVIKKSVRTPRSHPGVKTIMDTTISAGFANGKWTGRRTLTALGRLMGRRTTATPAPSAGISRAKRTPGMRISVVRSAAFRRERSPLSVLRARRTRRLQS